MKEAIVRKNLTVDVVDSPIPTPNADQVVIKTVFAGMNPKDWKVVYMNTPEHDTGDDIAGTVHSVGSNVIEFKPGDRVAAFHEMLQPGGAFAEYSLAFAYATFHLPKNTSFEEAATIPLAAMTSAVGLFKSLGLPSPWTPATSPTPLIIYGAASAVGAFAVKLAIQANIHPLLLVAGRGLDFVKSISGFDVSKGDAVVDYRSGDAAVIDGLKAALKSAGFDKVTYAYDAISEHNSDANLVQVLEPKASITTVLPGKEHPAIPKDMNHVVTSVGTIFKDDNDLGNVYFRHFTRTLGTGTFTAHPYEVRGGLESIEQALKDLKDGKASAVKYIFRIGDEGGA